MPKHHKKGSNRYTASKSLQRYLEKRLQLYERKQELTEAGKDPKELNDEIRESDRMKVYYLDEIIFPSMANLIYFLETVGSNPTLLKLFENDLKDLTGLRIKSQDRRSLYREFAKWSTRISDTPFERLVSGFLMTSAPQLGDFRMELVLWLQKMIYIKVTNTMAKTLGHDILVESAKFDLKRAMAWIILMSKFTREDDNEPERIIDFSSPYLEDPSK